MALVSWTTVLLLLGVSAGGVEPPAGFECVPLQVRHHSTKTISLTVQAVVNGRPVRLMVDTGASISCLDKRFADELKLVPVAHGQAVGSGFRHDPMPLLQLTEFRLGSVALRPQVGILDLAWLSDRDRHDGPEVVGLLGADVLQATGARVDFDRPALYLRNPVEWDRQRFQGSWRAVSLVRRGEPADPAGLSLRVIGSRAVLATGQPDGVRVLAATIDFSRNAFVPRSYTLIDIEHLDPPRQSKKVKVFGTDVTIIEPGMAFGLYGCYEFAGDRLMMTLPTDPTKDQRQVPSRLESTAGNGTDVVTFERDRSPADIRQHLARLVRGWVAGRTGWEVAVADDWTLTATHAGRRQRVTVRPDGSVTVGPHRPE